jgi:elongation factor P
MISAGNLRNGTTFLLNGQPYQTIKFSHIKMGRGGAVVKIQARNMITGATEDKSFSPIDKFDEMNTSRRRLQYLYNDGANASFMDPSTYEQVEIPVKVIKTELQFIKEGENADVLFWGEKVLSIDLPPKVTLTITETDPGVKGNSASNVYKDAILENGLKVRVPLFIEKLEKVRVDTRTGEYVERAK